MAKSEFSLSESYRYDRSGTIRWIISHVLRYRRYAALYILGSLLVSGLTALIPTLSGRAFDLVGRPDASRDQLLTIALVVLGCVLVRGVIDLLKSVAIEVLGKRMERDARDELYLSLLGKSQTFHSRQRVGDLLARTSNDVSLFNAMMNPGVDLIFSAGISVVVPLIFIGLLRAELLLTPLLFTVLLIIALRRYARSLGPVAGAMREQFGALNADLAETISGIEVVKSTAQEQQEQEGFSANARRYRELFVKHGLLQARYIPPLILAAAFAGALLHGLLLVSQGSLTIGELVAYMGLIDMLSFPAFISVFIFSLLQLGVAGAARMLALMNEETELDENERGHRAPIEGEIVFENVSFGYGEGAQLQGISFRARPGQTIAIVGQTGSGKSTLTKLVNRTYDAGGGRVLIDGVDVREWNLDALRSQISTIEQDIFLFSRSVADNIAFGLGSRADRAAVERAAREAQAHDFIGSFQDGYDTVIGERGVALSGGQRQRIAIARALLTDPRILILDDSTSAIDSATEDEIQKAIRRVLKGRTTLLITHRLSQIRWADQILVLKKGRLIDQGSHEELLARSEAYRRIFARYQASGARPQAAEAGQRGAAIQRQLDEVSVLEEDGAGASS